MNEHTLVNDTKALYNWVRNRTNAQIYIWGHSLGTGVGTQTVSKLNENGVQPSGLILEAPFSSVTDVVRENVVVKVSDI